MRSITTFSKDILNHLFLIFIVLMLRKFIIIQFNVNFYVTVLSDFMT